MLVLLDEDLVMKVEALLLVPQRMREDWTCWLGRFYPCWLMRPPLRLAPFAGTRHVSKKQRGQVRVLTASILACKLGGSFVCPVP